MTFGRENSIFSIFFRQMKKSPQTTITYETHFTLFLPCVIFASLYSH